jgi:hypothetical protein
MDFNIFKLTYCIENGVGFMLSPRFNTCAK